MGVFDFLRKKEFAEIDRLNEQIKDLSAHLEVLNKYQHVVDIEKEAERIRGDAVRAATQIIKKAEAESNEIRNKAKQIIEDAQTLKDNAQYLYDTKKEDALRVSAEIIKEARLEAKQLRLKSDIILDDATKQATTIVKNAENKAIEIAGDAYRAKQEAANLDQTIIALKNTIKGYGDDYLVPTYSMLDQLADDFGYEEAGRELKNARERSRLMVKNDLAAKCDYAIHNRRLTAINFTTDAFNGKVDTILANVKQDNFGMLKQKIIDAYHLVNNLGQAFRNAVITPAYLDARIEELKWAVLVIELKNQEREEQRRIKEQIREEEKAKREFERAIKDAEKEEGTIRKAIEKAMGELQTVSNEQRLKYEQKIIELNERLRIAEEKGQRALSMAQQTKSGHVYVISNIGSFGENVYKIGMTRRLEPQDRVRELGDASVPFSFDVHAMIYCDDAPNLENELHRYFIDNQVNKVNTRKEFFKVNLISIKEHVESLNLQAKWTMAANAAEYRETLAIEKELQTNVIKRKEWEIKQLQRIQEYSPDNDDEQPAAI